MRRVLRAALLVALVGLMLAAGVLASLPRREALRKNGAPGGGVPEAPQRPGRCGGDPSPIR